MTTGQLNLSAAETRVLACLLEKQQTTPDQYPLSLNALRLACNQSTNRVPVVPSASVTCPWITPVLVLKLAPG